jgi:hypothetical protein
MLIVFFITYMDRPRPGNELLLVLKLFRNSEKIEKPEAVLIQT